MKKLILMALILLIVGCSDLIINNANENLDANIEEKKLEALELIEELFELHSQNIDLILNNLKKNYKEIYQLEKTIKKLDNEQNILSINELIYFELKLENMIYVDRISDQLKNIRLSFAEIDMHIIENAVHKFKSNFNQPNLKDYCGAQFALRMTVINATYFKAVMACGPIVPCQALALTAKLAAQTSAILSLASCLENLE